LAAREEEDLSKHRTRRLMQLCEAGEADAAWDIYNGLVERRVANEYQAR
jgi:hypothetical protein